MIRLPILHELVVLYLEARLSLLSVALEVNGLVFALRSQLRLVDIVYPDGSSSVEERLSLVAQQILSWTHCVICSLLSSHFLAL